MEYEIDIAEAVRYMGYRGIEPDDRQMQQIKDCAALVKKTIVPAWVARVFPIEFADEGVRLAGTSLVMSGSDIREHLSGCHSCVLFCATAGSKADELIRMKEKEDITAGYFTDCLCSAAAEGICNAVERELSRRLSDKFLTWRFSPGYGDLPLDIQPDIIAVLDAGKRAGVSVTQSLLMIPRKSVTAVIGISDEPIEQKRRGCERCAIKDKCNFRKAGEHCGSKKNAE